MAEKSALHHLSAAELTGLYRRRQLSPVEVTRHAFDRIERFNRRFNAFCIVDPESALREARESEARWKENAPASRIDGVPATIKDLILTKGWPTLRGSRTVDVSQSWNEEAPATARLREAGAVLLGKTTTPEFGWKGVCDSPLNGVTRNPWNEKMTPGGSSGGAAVAAALKLGVLHVGTDGGGSIRIPAGFSGIFGHKPTFGLVPAFPLSPFGTIAHLGPMTACVDDAARMLTIMARPDARDWFALPYHSPDYTIGINDGVEGLRIALSTTLGYAKVDPEVAALVETAAEKLADAGAIVERCDPGFSDPAEIFEAHWFTGAASVRESIPREKWNLLDPGFEHFAARGAALGHMDYVRMTGERAQLGHRMSEFHTKYDILLTPTLPIVAFEAGQVAPSGMDQSNWVPWTPFSFPFNLTQQPAASIPCGFNSAGLPVGLQIVAAKYRDDLVLRVARTFESIQPIVLPDGNSDGDQQI